MKIILTPEARNDFARIGDYIASYNPTRAETFVDELLERSLRLKDMPFRYQLLAGREYSGIRRLPYRNYAIFYRVIDETVYILHILSAAQDHEAILFPEDEP
ncbi:type II toxin-antitoxin system RelE/ParE family toxin [Rhizobium wenxiniae]|uniref:type II toxin-antitoxin system RelE/ParE family toxin n=1 Tax=Rhizobium wenxiniae TaxID=1737357 RepID=UPI001C6EF908|nr:type II toxin-antitoxin system RelE/ParE family toxin [Rhizobium wenxiniae]MBW9090469.1 type II toxin-antitoxin system RelE/ParE family toxin [Rhizobium wenxiniae]